MPAVVTIAIQDGIATAVMNRPPVNAQSNQLSDELVAVFDSFTDREMSASPF